MSNESKPVRGRRQLRERSGQAGDAAGTPSLPVDPAPEAPQPAAAPRSERESQTRARDRAALRAYNELVDLASMNPLPSRRSLRQSQLDADRAPITSVNRAPITSVNRAPITSVNPVIAMPAVRPGQPARVAAPVAPPASAAAPVAATTAPPGVQGPPVRTRSGRRAAAASSPASQKAEQLAARNAAAPEPAGGRAARPLPAAAPGAATPAARTGTAGPQTRMAAPQEKTVPAADSGTAHHPAAEKYPTLPGLVPGGSYYPVSAGPPPAAPSDNELQALAAQRAEADRAAILSQRAQARERLAQESLKSKRQAADPTATDNLAMVTPLEFIDMPGSSRPVLRPPATTHVPILTRPTLRQLPARPKPAAAVPARDGQPAAPAPAPAMRSVSAERFDAAVAARAVQRPGPGKRPLTGGRSSTLQKAEAMATGGGPAAGPAAERSGVQRSHMPPMPADYAHGLEPLDAMTAGLGRTQRNMLIQWGSILVGGAALIVGTILFITALAR